MKLDYVIDVLAEPLGISRQTFFNHCVEEKLSNAYDIYQRAIEASKEYILSRDNLKVLKTLEREAKKEDKLNGKDN